MRSPDSFVVLFGEQIRATGLAMRRELILGGIALALVCLFSIVMGLRYDEQLDFSPDVLLPGLFVAMLLPFAVWKGDAVFGRAYLWTLPVRRQHAAAAKILAGACWMLLAMLVAAIMLSLVARVTGGTIGVSGVRLVGETVATAQRVAWSTPFWMWILPFSSALILYLFSSALLLGVRHPVWWAAGSVVGFMVLTATIATIGPDGAFERAIEPIRAAVWSGRAGLDYALNGGGSAHTVDRPGPGYDILWSALPDMSRWALATIVWLGLALLAMALAIRRHWER